MLSKERFIDNVLYMIKRRGETVSAFEKSINITIGYLMKLKNDDSRKITAELMLLIANALGVSVEMLCYADINRLSDDEIMMISFFASIRNDTFDGKYKWERESAASIYRRQGIIGEKLIYVNDYDERTYVSAINGGIPAVLEGDSYSLELKKDTYLLVVSVRSEKVENGLELYICENDILHRLCEYNPSMPNDFDIFIKDLYEVARISGEKIYLEQQTRDLIKKFIKKPIVEKN